MKKYITITLSTDELYASYTEMEYKEVHDYENSLYLGVETPEGVKYSIPHRLIKEIRTWTEEETTAEK